VADEPDLGVGVEEEKLGVEGLTETRERET